MPHAADVAGGGGAYPAAEFQNCKTDEQMIDISSENFVLVGALLLGVAVMAGKVAYRFGAPALLLFLGVGMVVGANFISFHSVEMTQFIGMILKNLQDLRIHDETGLGNLAQTLDENVVRQRCERLQVGEHSGRSVERTDQILSLRCINASFTTGRSINHGKQRRRTVHIANTTHPCGCHKTSQIGCRSTTKTDNRIGTGETLIAQALPNTVGHLDGLASLRIRNDNVVRIIACLTKQRARTIRMTLHRLHADQLEPLADQWPLRHLGLGHVTGAAAHVEQAHHWHEHIKHGDMISISFLAAACGDWPRVPTCTFATRLNTGSRSL